MCAMQELKEGPSRHEIWKMFDQISPTYDCVNRVLSLGMHQLWRRRLCHFLPSKTGMRILDCATGTGDQIIALLEKRPDIASVIGIDLAKAMIELGKEKIAKKPFAHKVELHAA